jgi:hypothetical protein
MKQLDVLSVLLTLGTPGRKLIIYSLVRSFSRGSWVKEFFTGHEDFSEVGSWPGVLKSSWEPEVPLPFP